MEYAGDEMPLVANAMEFLARASSTSEDLTLNLTNLLILLVLKALIFGFGLFSVGGTGRSAEESVLTPAKMIYKGYKLVGMHIADKYATVMNSVNDAMEY